VEDVPFHCINCQVMPFVSLKILTTVSLRTKMDFSLLGSNQEQRLIELVEIKAHTSSVSVEKSLFLVLYKFLILINH